MTALTGGCRMRLPAICASAECIDGSRSRNRLRTGITSVPVSPYCDTTPSGFMFQGLPRGAARIFVATPSIVDALPSRIFFIFANEFLPFLLAKRISRSRAEFKDASTRVRLSRRRRFKYTYVVWPKDMHLIRRYINDI